ncbi:MAG: hypothetical protein ACRD9L_21535 [Bryobacteraceae bacterium]
MAAPVSPRVLAAFLAISSLHGEVNKLTFQDRVEIVRGMMAEFATAKVLLPRSKKALPFESTGKYDKAKWDGAAREFGPAARVGDQVQITRVTIEDKRIVLEINHGMKGGDHWYKHIEVGMGGSMSPVSTDQSTSAPSGTTISLEFKESVPEVQAAQLKKMLAPILDFDKHSATETYTATLPPAVKQAIKENRAIEGMDRDQVVLAMGKPVRKIREEKEGVETEDWIYGQPPGKITFVTFNGSKVVHVKEDYAGLGGSVAAPSKTPRDY